MSIKRNRSHATLTDAELLRKAFFRGDGFDGAEFPQPKLLMEPWLAESSYNLIYAPAGVGKTFFCLSIVIAVATGGKMMDWCAVKPVGVLYVDGEVGCTEIQLRLKQMSGGIIPKNISVLSTPQMVVEGGATMNLANEHWRIEFYRLLKEHPDIRMIVFDNVSCLFSGIEDSDKEPWDEPNQFLIGLRSEGYCVILIHHTGKDIRSGPRGTSSREDAVNMSIMLSRLEGYNQSEGCVFKIEWKKSRSIFGHAIRTRNMKLMDNVRPYFVEIDIDSPERQLVREYLSAHPEEINTPSRTLADKIGVGRTTVTVVKHELIK